MTNYTPRTALLVVDVQNDFAHPDGSLAVPGAAQVLEVANREVRAARDAGAPVIYTQDWHPDSTPHFEKDGGVWPVHCVGDTWGAAFHDDLLVDGPSIRKGVDGGDGYSGFSVRDPQSGETTGTQLAAVLREHGIESVVIVGLATDYCVVETAVDAVGHGFSATVLEGGVAGVDLKPGDSQRALDRMRSAGVTVE